MIKLHEGGSKAVIHVNIDHIKTIQLAEDCYPNREGSMINEDVDEIGLWVAESPHDILVRIRTQRRIRANYNRY